MPSNESEYFNFGDFVEPFQVGYKMLTDVILLGQHELNLYK